MNKEEFLDHWKDAIDKGTFLTGKHDPASLGTPYPTFRSVTIMSQPEIKVFLETGDYTLRRFHNNREPQSPEYIEITPNDPLIVAGSGVPSKTAFPTTACDRFIAVSGVKLDWHLFAEQSCQIQLKQASGDLTYLGDL
jgi:hypothetical protein